VLTSWKSRKWKLRSSIFIWASIKAAGIAYTTLGNNYPYSDKADSYKLSVIKSYYKYATLVYRRSGKSVIPR
jgi:hypothetical protein